MNHRCFKAYLTLRRLVFVLQAKQRWRHQQPAGVCRVVGDCSAIKPSARTPTTAKVLPAHKTHPTTPTTAKHKVLNLNYFYKQSVL